MALVGCLESCRVGVRELLAFASLASGQREVHGSD